MGQRSWGASQAPAAEGCRAEQSNSQRRGSLLWLQLRNVASRKEGGGGGGLTRTSAMRAFTATIPAMIPSAPSYLPPSTTVS